MLAIEDTSLDSIRGEKKISSRGWLWRISKKEERKNSFSLGFKKQEGEVVWGVFSSLVGVFFCKKGKKKGANESLKKGSK